MYDEVTSDIWQPAVKFIHYNSCQKMVQLFIIKINSMQELQAITRFRLLIAITDGTCNSPSQDQKTKSLQIKTHYSGKKKKHTMTKSDYDKSCQWDK